MATTNVDEQMNAFVIGNNYHCQPLDDIVAGLYGVVCSAIHIHPSQRKVAIKNITAPFNHPKFCLQILREIKVTSFSPTLFLASPSLSSPKQSASLEFDHASSKNSWNRVHPYKKPQR
ncbi:mitogen activated protein kinase [Marasmius sp. AFHP31]|nr:mitogen activated protein kinase [Marasmius sp. AFHP31]